MYDGSARSARQFCMDCGFKMPQECKPADWLLFIAQSEPEQRLEGAGFYSSSNEEQQLNFGRVAQATGSILTSPNNDERRVSFSSELNELLWREIKHTSRDLVPLITRFV